MIRVAVDAMGGDHAPAEIVRGAVSALSREPDLFLLLVGRKKRVQESLQGLTYPANRLSIVDAADIIEGNDDPGMAIRAKKDASMVVAFKLLRSGEADAVLSAGNTGAFMAAGLMFSGRLSGISRPALLAVMPSFNGNPVVVLDVGANMDARPDQLLQYAFMGRIYAQQLLGYRNPRVALLNVGSEPNKGNSQLKKTYPLFTEHVTGFCGNIEGDSFFFDAAEVVVCDGFVGNVLLKAAEGVARGMLGDLKKGLSSSLRNRLGAALLMPALLRIKDKVDDTEYGGAPLVGIKGVCIKCHGSSRAVTIEQALIKQVLPFVRNRVIGKFQDALQAAPILTGGDNYEQA